ncbi:MULTISPECIES: methylated-DNA--[protein]-cysteine S-methyltransferase [Aneurinibacillus]|uniref:Methylated-DNA--protein-cysteine methyltransferase n=1 Tax=Aneurinibacillus thermoaerophilus TaxID=143495 RepID=A0A1G7WN78_ANETH|nr:MULTISPECIES: methylated-DNA--[protein]-cysteine S-methyltransferase [Aneurinibacillus]AMA74047.1 [Fe-S]-binding protein [Aneurinibacillus sp. XH2]MED0675841.1 methylated-DNA--[protein]-cysteine S-methyltransferase [Aneurinibacillus thermoaerophilus]MED0678199.1 methylated-DNA--[protein]-cysteine S-methyltransferase [Aneurinibacillus thermoaerophilus]MED0737916.1 methylated-DNA--[protein]-cysteine S-methyltransferase [Aneurinibacillus thermoaerophilus]MED0755605.1 methylated-DNA--[protein]-
MKSEVYYTVYQSPLGPITLAAADAGMCWVEFGESETAKLSLVRWTKKWLHTEKITYAPKFFLEATKQLDEYFAGKRREFTLPLDIHGTAFQKMVWEQLRRIPYGETRSYKDIALAINAAKAVRAIGGANNKNPLSIFIPCHRVIGSNGALVGYGGGLHIKEYLLRLEGVLERSEIGFV